ncbi:isochorismate synthase MenF [Nonomuraea sp. NPDC050536]|uniref:isochorismate synthase MenF n=1 Tax=Nonomuraea sp. NPDC050536 TaxID=3364366 RepID=UPI0037CA9B3C
MALTLPDAALETGAAAAHPSARFLAGAQAAREQYPQLLAGFDATSTVLFSGDTYTLLATGHRLASARLADLPEQVAAAQADGQVLVAGAISYDSGSSALLACEQPRWQGPLLEPMGCYRCGHRWDSITADPSPEHYQKMVRRARDLIRAGDLDKVVLARSMTLRAPWPVGVHELLAHTIGRGRHTYCVPLATDRLLVGASPELVMARHGDEVTAQPLAGSVPRVIGDASADQKRADGLRRSRKDLAEHRLVVDAVAAALAPYCAELDVPDTPDLVRTPTLWHLGTSIRGRLAAGVSSLHLAAALHPTPAVCGTPTDRARDLIAELEPFGRGWYAGLVGWQAPGGDGEWALTLRCAVLDGGTTLRVWAGAGIVADSDPAAELAETDAKFATLLGPLRATTYPDPAVPVV